ncbi:MAG: hypothetical protein NZ874_04750 [Fimbriimonadales bacterium]|nr:hypothetical protein [Fimbriimonadales bacterium]
MESVFAAMLVWLLAAAWIFFLVSWAVTGDVSAGEAIIGSVVALLLALASAQRAFPYAIPFSLLTLGGGAVALPFLRAYLNRAAHARMDAELIERACLAYEFDPKNYGSLINLAEVCYKNGLLEQAVHHLERAIQVAPLMTASEKHRLKLWQEELEHAHKHGYTPCMHCGARQPVGAVRCDRCNALLLPLLVQGRWIPRQLLQKVIGVWGVSVGAIGLSLFWREQLTGLSALVTILATLVVALALITWVIRKR